VTPPVTPLIPADAMSSTPNLGEEPKTRPRAQALVDDEEAGEGLEEVEPDRASGPPSIDSADEIDTSDLVVAVPPAPAARPVSTPPKPAPPIVSGAKPPPPKEAPKEPAVAKEAQKETPKTGGMIPIVAPGSAGVASPLAPPPLTEGLVPRRRARPWWEDLFNDDFIRTMPKFTEAQVAEEVDFIEDSLGVARGGSLLDLGCGTGRQAVELSRRGYSVVGFDLSISMLARAGEEAQEQSQKINFVQGDMREMTFEDAFDGIYCWGSTFGYFEEEKNLHVISRVHKALRQGGQFLLDVVSRDFAIKQAPSLAWFEGEGCVCMDEMTVDWITSRMRIKRTMMLDDGRSKEIEYSIRIYSLHELGKMLHDGGFRVAEVSGRIQTPGVFFGPDSPRTLILAEKR
jgi:SAM-dependent methyltransferase